MDQKGILIDHFGYMERMCPSADRKSFKDSGTPQEQMKKRVGSAAGIIKRPQPFGETEPEGLGMRAESFEVLGL